MADYQGKMSSLSVWASPGFPAWTFFLARGVTPRVMDTRVYDTAWPG